MSGRRPHRAGLPAVLWTAGLGFAFAATSAFAQSAYESLQAGGTVSSPAGTGAAADTASAATLDLTGLPSPLPADLGGMLVKLGLAMIIVLAIIVVMQRVARRWGRNLGGVGGGDDIRVLAQRALGPRVTLMVVETLGQRFLIGMSPQGVHRVAELGEADLFENEPIPAPRALQGADMGLISGPTHLGPATGPTARPTTGPTSGPTTGLASGATSSRMTGATAVSRDEASIGFTAQLRERLQSLRSWGAPAPVGTDDDAQVSTSAQRVTGR